MRVFYLNKQITTLWLNHEYLQHCKNKNSKIMHFNSSIIVLVK